MPGRDFRLTDVRTFGEGSDRVDSLDIEIEIKGITLNQALRNFG
jgi:hypothetical protein